MKKIAFWTLLFILMIGNGFAAEFNSDSAIFTNPYFPLRLGDHSTLKGYGTLNGAFMYHDLVAEEVIDGIHTLKRRTSFSGRQEEGWTIWLAQDVNGNILVVKYYDDEEKEEETFGAATNMLLVPAEPKVGQVLLGGDITITAINQTLHLSTGLGTYSNCFVGVFNGDNGDIDVGHSCLGIGFEIKDAWDDDGAINGWELNPSPLPAPQLHLSVNNKVVTVSWSSVSGATGYRLYYAPSDVSSINTIDLQEQLSLSVELWEGAAFYVAIKAYNNELQSDYSNIESFVLSGEEIEEPPVEAATFDGTWRGEALLVTGPTKPGFVCSNSMQLLVTIANSEVNGTVTSIQGKFVIEGHVNVDTGHVSGYITEGSSSFEGVLSGNSGQGTWLLNASGCQGTFTLNRER